MVGLVPAGAEPRPGERVLAEDTMRGEHPRLSARALEVVGRQY